MTTVTLIVAQAVNGALTSPGVDIPAGLGGVTRQFNKTMEKY